MRIPLCRSCQKDLNGIHRNTTHIPGLERPWTGQNSHYCSSEWGTFSNAKFQLDLQVPIPRLKIVLVLPTTSLYGIEVNILNGATWVFQLAGLGAISSLGYFQTCVIWSKLWRTACYIADVLVSYQRKGRLHLNICRAWEKHRQYSFFDITIFHYLLVTYIKYIH